MAHECLIEWNGFQSFKSRDFFSPLAARRKQSDGKETSSDDAEPDDSEELAVEYASLTDEQLLKKPRVTVHITSNNLRQNGGYPHNPSFSGPLKMVAA